MVCRGPRLGRSLPTPPISFCGFCGMLEHMAVEQQRSLARGLLRRERALARGVNVINGFDCM